MSKWSSSSSWVHDLKPLILQSRFALPAKPVREGAHGALFKATDLLRENQPVAVKLFQPSRMLQEDVLREAWSNELNGYQALGEHRNLVDLIDWGRSDHDDAPYLVFEWLKCDLMDHLYEVDLEGWDDFWPLARDILGGLSLIHKNFVHRDLKPENVLLSEGGVAKVADFGTMRLVEKINLGRTMGPLGTVPYSPPERGTDSPTPAYDVFSFAVLAVVCLSKTVPTDREGVLQALGSLDLPPEIESILTKSLAIEPSERFESASVLLAELGMRELRRARAEQPEVRLFVNVPPRVREQIGSLLGLSEAGVEAYIKEDISGLGAVAFDNRGHENPDLQIAGGVLLYRCKPDRTHPGLLTVMRASRPPATVVELARTRWWRPALRVRTSLPPDAAEAATTLASFLTDVAEHDAELAVATSEAEPDLFPDWRQVLKAKFAIEDERSEPIRYSGFTVQGSRVVFEVADLPAIELNEGRLVRSGRRRVLFGEVDRLENNRLSLFVTRGKVAELPRSGVLEFDAEASKSKLRREQAALDRVADRRALRPDLRELLLDPAKSRHPSPEPLEDISDRLDEVKRKAVSAALGAPDFMLVQGPPGTGKTTFIAELVRRFLATNPGSRVLLTSQTHIALDNALLRISAELPDARLLRIGRTEKFSEEIEPFAAAAQLEEWRVEVVQSGQAFLKALAVQLGVDLGEFDFKAVAADLQRRRAQLRELRSSIALRQAERREVLQQLELLEEMAPQVLAVAERIDAAIRAATSEKLQFAAAELVDQGLQLAAALEGGAPISEKLVELETSLSSWRQDERAQAEQERAVRSELAAAVNLDTDDADALIAAAEAKGQHNDPRLSQLAEIAAEWEERFGKDSDFETALLIRSDVVAATCVGIAGVPGFDQVPFDLCIIDEASKATTTEVLVPLSCSRRWVLVGDERQLPPFVDHALRDPGLLARFDLNREKVQSTLFSSLADSLPEECVVQLTSQHRMHPTIGRLISDVFYDGVLTSQPREVSPVIELALGAPVLWLDTSGLPDRQERITNSKSVRNRREARAIAGLLDRLNFVASSGSRALDVAVLTGYDAQRRELLDALAPNELSRTSLHVRVATVDAYQGQEADVVIFSVTRSNNENELGFLRSEERVNVALSRARDGLVVVGDLGFVERNRDGRHPLARVAQHVRSHDGCSIEAVDSE